jgi:hypothetical protein
MIRNLIFAILLVLLPGCHDESPLNRGPEGPDPEPNPPPAGESGDIQLSPAIRYQTMMGWEAAAQAGQADFPSLFPQYRDILFDQAVNDLGLTRLRIGVYSGMENSQDLFTEWLTGVMDNATYRCQKWATVNDNADPLLINLSGFRFAALDHAIDNVVLPMRTRVMARGERFYVSLNYIGPTQTCASSVSYHHAAPAEYAEFILAAFQHMQQKYGFVPDAVELVNEPERTKHWRGPLMGQALVAAGDLLKHHGFTPDFIGPSGVSVRHSGTYFDEMMQVPRARDYLTDLSYHRYSDATTENVRAAGQRGIQHGVRTAMLERIGAGYQQLHEDLKLGHVSSWEQFALAFVTNDDGAQYYVVNAAGGAPVVQMASRTRYLRQYFRFVRPGAVRIEASTSAGSFDPVAFINANGRYVVVVKAAGSGMFTVAGLPAGTYGIVYTTSQQFAATHPDVQLESGRALQTSIPREGVLTIYGK